MCRGGEHQASQNEIKASGRWRQGPQKLVHRDDLSAARLGSMLCGQGSSSRSLVSHCALNSLLQSGSGRKGTWLSHSAGVSAQGTSNVEKQGKKFNLQLPHPRDLKLQKTKM